MSEEAKWNACGVEALLEEFFSQDDIRHLAVSTGELLDCPLLVLDDTFRIAAYHQPLNFADELFQHVVRSGEITYGAGVIISKSPALSAGMADYVQLPDSPYRRRFAPLVSAGVRLGCLVCVDVDGHLDKIPAQTWEMVEHILAKQLFVETSRRDKVFETAEDILMHLLEGGFSSNANFRLQAANTYLADFHPLTFALIDLESYHNTYFGKQHLRETLESRIPDSHPFLYEGDIFLFLHREADAEEFPALADEFKLKVLVAEPLGDLFDLPKLYRTAKDALELMTDERFHGEWVYSVEQLRTPLMLKILEGHGDLVPLEIRRLAAHDREKNTQYCRTLYYYLTCCRSLKKTCDALYTHRNTVLYRIRRLQEDFALPLEEPSRHAELLLGVSLVLFETEGPDFFLQKQETDGEEHC